MYCVGVSIYIYIYIHTRTTSFCDTSKDTLCEVLAVMSVQPFNLSIATSRTQMIMFPIYTWNVCQVWAVLLSIATCKVQWLSHRTNWIEEKRRRIISLCVCCVYNTHRIPLESNLYHAFGIVNVSIKFSVRSLGSIIRYNRLFPMEQ